nr:hypothetical protein [Pandoravirus massiliensis]
MGLLEKRERPRFSILGVALLLFCVCESAWSPHAYFSFPTPTATIRDTKGRGYAFWGSRPLRRDSVLVGSVGRPKRINQSRTLDDAQHFFVRTIFSRPPLFGVWCFCAKCGYSESGKNGQQ